MAGQTLLGDRYRLGVRIGRGGMGEIRIGLDTRLGRVVAVKQLSRALAADPGARARFHREAQAAARLNHPAVVAVLDSGEERDSRSGTSTPYIVMELVVGQTLRTLLHRGQRMAPQRALELVQGILDALAHSHAAGILHQDIKPSNVMVTPAGAVKLMDFGIARAMVDDAPGPMAAHEIFGTAKYLSPEQARAATTDARSDLYSVGCLLYELLVGQPPFPVGSAQEIAGQHLHQAPTPPSEVDAALGSEFDAVVLKALAKDPEQRYQSAREMRTDVARVRSGHTLVLAPVPPRPFSEERRTVPDDAWILPEDEERRRGGGRRSAPVSRPNGPRRRRAALVTSALVAGLFPLGGLGLYNLAVSGSGGDDYHRATAYGVTRTETTTGPRQTAEPADRAGTTSANPTPGTQQPEPAGRRDVAAARREADEDQARDASRGTARASSEVSADKVSGDEESSSLRTEAESTSEAVHPEKTGEPASPSTARSPEKTAQPTQRVASQQPRTPAKPTQPVEARQPGDPTTPGKPAVSSEPPGVTKPERSERPGRERPGKPGKWEKPGKPGKWGKPGKPGKWERPGKPGRWEKPGKAEKPEKTGQPEKRNPRNR